MPKTGARLRKVGAMAEAAGISMAPHACEGPIGGIATLHVDAAPAPREAELGLRIQRGGAGQTSIRRVPADADVFHPDGSVAEW